MIEQILRKHSDKFNLKTVHLKDFKVNKENINNIINYAISDDFTMFLKKYLEFPDPFIIIPSHFYFREQAYRNLLVAQKRYELMFRYINGGSTKISLVLVSIDNEFHYKVIKNFFFESNIDTKYTGDFTDTFIVFMEKNI